MYKILYLYLFCLDISPPGWQKSKGTACTCTCMYFYYIVIIGYKRYPLHSSTSLINTPIEERQEDIIDGLSADSSGIDSPVLSGDLSAAIYSSVTPRSKSWEIFVHVNVHVCMPQKLM